MESSSSPANKPRPSTHPPSKQVMEMQSVEYVGPLPPPHLLKQYEEVHPGLAERIIAQFEKQVDHRIQGETRILEAQISRQNVETTLTKRGQNYAFCIVMMALGIGGAGVITASICNSSAGIAWAGASICGFSLVSLVGVFIYGRSRKSPSKGDAQGQSRKT